MFLFDPVSFGLSGSVQASDKLGIPFWQARSSNCQLNKVTR
jgi:hypothetical protein